MSPTLSPEAMMNCQGLDLLCSFATEGASLPAMAFGDVDSTKILVTLPHCFIQSNGNFFRSASIYILSAGFDLSGADETELPKEVLENGAAPITRTSSRRLTITASQLFSDVTSNYLLPVLGAGPLLYGPRVPNGYFSMYLALMNHRGGYRDLGRVVEECTASGTLNSVLAAAIGAGTGDPTAIIAAENSLRLFFAATIYALQNCGDTVIQDCHFSALAEQRYLLGTHMLRGERAQMAIRVSRM